MSANTLIVPVSDTLRAELVSTENYLKSVAGIGLNDRSHYRDAVTRLEALTMAVLSLPGRWSPLMPVPMTARIDVAPRGAVASLASECAEYLGNDAASLLRHQGGALGAYHADHTADVVIKIKGLLGIVMLGIRREAEADLRSLSDCGADVLLGACNGLAKAAAPKTAQAGNESASV